jgi:hypothetical protein
MGRVEEFRIGERGAWALLPLEISITNEPRRKGKGKSKREAEEGDNINMR